MEKTMTTADRSETASGEASPAQRAEALALDFLRRVWSGEHDLNAIDELMTGDFEISSGGVRISGRAAFKEWVRAFQDTLAGSHTENLDVFANAAGDRVVSRWRCSGINRGIFGLPPDGRLISFTGMAMWRVRDGRLAECWVERAAFEAYHAVLGQTTDRPPRATLNG
jgi:predicted ester cyclase